MVLAYAPMSSRLLVLGGALSVAAVVVAQGAAKSQTTAPPAIIPIKITMTDTTFIVTPKSAPRAAFGRFILTNRGKKAHAFTLGSAKRGIGIQTGFTKLLKPDQQAILVLFLDYRGTIAYRGSLPADRNKTRMKGFFRIF